MSAPLLPARMVLFVRIISMATAVHAVMDSLEDSVRQVMNGFTGVHCETGNEMDSLEDIVRQVMNGFTGGHFETGNECILSKTL